MLAQNGEMLWGQRVLAFPFCLGGRGKEDVSRVLGFVFLPMSAEFFFCFEVEINE